MVWTILGITALMLGRMALNRRPPRRPQVNLPLFFRDAGFRDGRGGGPPDPRTFAGQRDFPGVIAFAANMDYISNEYGPRNLANLSTRVGDYIVGVRRVTFPNTRADLFPNPITSVPPSNCQVTLEIYSPNLRALQRIRDFAAQCTATDDKGKTLVSDPNQPGRSMSKGLMRYVSFASFSSQARVLRQLEGEIIITASDVPAFPHRLHPSLSDNPDEYRARMGGMPLGRREREDARPESRSVETKTKRLKFRLENIPLPVGVHVFGVASAAYVPTAKAEVSSNALTAPPAVNGQTNGAVAPAPGQEAGKAQLLPEAQAQNLAPLFPPIAEFIGPLKLPTRLLLTPDIENRFNIPLKTPFAFLSGSRPMITCRLTPHLGVDGEIALTGDATLPPGLMPGASTTSTATGSRPQPVVVPISCRVWDNTPEILVLIPPAPPIAISPTAPSASLPSTGSAASPAHPPDRRLAIRLHLYLEMPPPTSDFQPPSVTPYLPSTGQVGGEMRGQILVLNTPLRYGAAQLEIVRDGASGTGGQTNWVVLDSEGRWRFANLAPGHYTIRVRDIQPYRNAITTPGPVADYLRRRYGVIHPVWENAVQSGLLVTGGNLTTPLPARLVNADRTASR